MIKNNEWINIKDAAKCSIYTKKQIRKLAEQPCQRIRSRKEDGHIYFNKLDILKYAASHPRDIIFDTVWDKIDYIEGECFYPLFGYDYKYFVSNKQRVINATTGQVLTPILQIDKDGRMTGYRSVALMCNGKKRTEALHRLVGRTQCKNALGKDIYHHIKVANPSIDKASNLLPVWESQHVALHRLLRAGKKEEYKKMVEAIKQENAQKLYRIPHPDLQPDGKYNYCLLVTAEGNKAFKSGAEIPFSCIIKECAERTSEVK